MNIVSLVTLADVIIISVAIVKGYQLYKNSLKKEYQYYLAFMAGCALVMLMQGLPGSFINDPLIVNLCLIIGYSFFVPLTVAFAVKMSFIVLKKEVLGNFFFWLLMFIGIAALFLNAHAHKEATLLEGEVFGGWLTLAEWRPNFTESSMVFLIIAIVIGIMCFPFLLLILMSDESSRITRARVFLTASGLLLVGSMAILYFILFLVPTPHFIEISALDAIGAAIGYLLFAASFFFYKKKEVALPELIGTEP